MKNLIAYILLALALTVHCALADTSIGNLPPGSASGSGSSSVFPYTDSTTHTTKKMLLSDLVNLPAFGSFNAATATALYSAPTGCSAGQFAVGIDVHGNLTCSAVTSGINQLTGDVTAGPGAGSQAATVALVGGSSASLIHSAELAANAATSANTVSKIVARDGSGNFSAGTITATLSGNATNITASSNSSLTSLPSLSLPYTQLSGTVPTWNQSTTGNAATASAFDHTPSACSAGTFASAQSATGALTCSTPAGTGVTSVALTAPSWLSVSGSPVTSSGTLAVTAATGQTANYFLAAPNGSSGAISPRAIVAADIPTLNQNTTGTAANVTATSNSTLTTLSALSLPYTQLSGTVPTWNQNTTGNAATATALAATPTKCSAGNYPLGVDAGGNAVSCTAAGSGSVTSVTGTAPVVSSGGATPAISMAHATFANDGYMSSTDASNLNSLSGAATALGTYGSTPNNFGGSLGASGYGSVLTLQPADATHPGGVSTGAQTFGGTKTFGTLLATTLNSATIGCGGGSCTFLGTPGKSVAFNNSLSFSGTDGTTLNIGSGAALNALAALTPATDTIPYFSSSSAAGTITVGTGLTFSGGVLAASGGGGGGAATTQSITQAAHGFTVGQWLYYTGTAYALAKADADSTSEVVGVVSAVGSSSTFTLLNVGQVTGLSGLTAGTTYYLSDTTAGAITSSAPSATAHVNKPLLVAYSTTAGFAIQSRGFVVGVANGNDGGVKFVLENALPNSFTTINGAHYQQATQTLSIVYLSVLNSGLSGSTTIQVNQYRAGALQGTATASIASNGSLPASSAVSLSSSLSLIAGDLLTVDLTSAALSAADLTVEWGLAAPASSQTSGTLSIVTKTTSYSLTAADDTVIFNCTSPCTATLQASATAFAKIRRLKNIGVYPLTVVSAGGSDTFEDGTNSFTINPGIAPFPAGEFQPDGGTQWYVF